MKIRVVLFLLAGFATAVVAQNEVAIELAPFTIERTLEGLLMPEPGGEVKVEVEVWSDLVVAEAVAHGTLVKQGDVVLRLDTASLERRIDDVELEVATAEHNMKRAELDLAYFKTVQAVALREARRALALAQEDDKLFREHDVPFEQLKTGYKTQDSLNNLVYQKEELRQLKRMYEEDQITEETEEIILKRQTDTVAKQAALVKEWELFQKKQDEIELPRKQKAIELGVEKKTFDLKKIEALQPIDLAVKEITLKQTRQGLAKSRLNLEKMKGDLKAMTMTAPRDGVVYYGRFSKSDWVSTDADKLVAPGARPTKNAVLMTIVPPVIGRAQVWLKEGDALLASKLRDGVLIPKSDARARLPAKVESVSVFPKQKGWYEVYVGAVAEDLPVSMRPGVGCWFMATAYHQDQAIAIPANLVFKDPSDLTQRFVWVADEAGATTKRIVYTGYEDGGKLEIIDGLKPGEKVVGKPAT